MANINHPPHTCLLAPVGQQPAGSANLLVRKTPGQIYNLEASFTSFLEGTNPPSLTLLLHSNKQFITGLDVQLFIPSVLALKE